ncbi:MAG TPA: hypothetical protein DD661_00300, partial [Gammaproteobacteria bacterium]|nr:hypothetical protein [Gammaproteobacteria bacterium]
MILVRLGSVCVGTRGLEPAAVFESTCRRTRSLKEPVDPLRLDRAVRRHLGPVQEFRNEGFTWSRIAHPFAAVGIRRA